MNVPLSVSFFILLYCTTINHDQRVFVALFIFCSFSLVFKSYSLNFSSGKSYQKSMALIRLECIKATATYNWNVLVFIIMKLQVISTSNMPFHKTLRCVFAFRWFHPHTKKELLCRSHDSKRKRVRYNYTVKIIVFYIWKNVL